MADEALQSRAKKLGLPDGWLANILSTLETTVVNELLTFLESLIAAPVPTPTKQGKKRPTCCPEDLECLDKVICQQIQALNGLLCFRGDCCCDK